MDIYSIVRGEGDSGGEADSLLRFEMRNIDFWLANGKMQYSETELKELPMMM